MSIYPKVVPQDLEDEIAVEEYKVYGHTTLCFLTLKNGVISTGVNHGSADPRNFDAELGKTYARKGAIERMWPLLGFRLADKLHAIRSAPAPYGKILEHGEPVTYIHTPRVVHAVPITKKDWAAFCGRELSADEDGDANGYLVQVAGAHRELTHWSSRDDFEQFHEVGMRL